MQEMDTKVEATCPNNWDDSDIANPDLIKEEGFDDAIKLEPELEETDLHDYPLAIKDESVEYSDGAELEIEACIIKEERDAVDLKLESELEGSDIDDYPTTIKCETVEFTDEAGSEIEPISSYGEEDEGDVSLELTKEESCEDKYEASVKSEDIDSPTEYDSDLVNSISVKEEAVQNDNEPPDVIILSEEWPEDWECDQADDDDSDEFGAAVVLVPRRPSGPPNSGGAEQQMYEPEPESPTRTSPNRRRKHGVADLGSINDQKRSKRTRLGDDMIDEEPIFLYATVRENSQSMFYMNRSVRSCADEEEYVKEEYVKEEYDVKEEYVKEEYVKEEELCMSWA